jgi:hypothetical protein
MAIACIATAHNDIPLGTGVLQRSTRPVEGKLMKIPVLVNPTAQHLAWVNEAIKTVNELQRYFRLKIEKAAWLPNDPEEEVDEGAVLKIVE